ncbi:chymotrypsinogen A [Ixodes scapularis]|uniref:chymotrypsinogen A n=1 Tax=Ixodes scapularis TaxID=6945 RepID=UPI001A9DBB01|nr:chymotrypsinogen A [Ixodes scapularis]
MLSVALCLVVGALMAKSTSGSQEACGRPPIPPTLDDGDRILGGSEAVPGSWPWQVGFLDHPFLGGEFFCSGVLIDDQHVVTASHCVRYLESKALFNVHLGSHQRESRDKTEVVAKVAHICEHRLSYRTYNDIAILRLKKKVIFNDFIQPVCLPEPSLDDDLPANTTVYATGWGKTTSDMEGPLSDVLKQLQTETMDHDECQGYLKLKLLDSMLCTRHSYGSTCHGDSGGPLVRQTADGAWVLEGVLAGGPPVCGVTSTPMRFTKVSRFVRWIQDYRSRKTRAALENFCKPRAAESGD